MLARCRRASLLGFETAPVLIEVDPAPSPAGLAAGRPCPTRPFRRRGSAARAGGGEPRPHRSPQGRHGLRPADRTGASGSQQATANGNSSGSLVCGRTGSERQASARCVEPSPWPSPARRHRAARFLVPDGNAAEAGLICELPYRSCQNPATGGGGPCRQRCLAGVLPSGADQRGCR